MKFQVSKAGQLLIGFALSVFCSAQSSGGIPWLPQNVTDSRYRAEASFEQVDSSLPFVFLNLEKCYFNLGDPVSLTVSVVNLTNIDLVVSLDEFRQSLSLSACGTQGGTSIRTSHTFAHEADTHVGPKSVKQFELKLTDLFQIAKAGVYTLQFQNRLEDGRVHISSPITFLVVDSSAIDAAIKKKWPEPGQTREAVAKMLKANSYFSNSSDHRVDEEFGISWRDCKKPWQLWKKSDAEAREFWNSTRNAFEQELNPEERVQVIQVVSDQILDCTDNLKCTHNDEWFQLAYVLSANTFKVTESVGGGSVRDWKISYWMKLAKCGSKYIAGFAIAELGKFDNKECISLLFQTADGTDKELAAKAISSLSSCHEFDEAIVAFLQKKSRDADPTIASTAAETLQFLKKSPWWQDSRERHR